MKDTPKHIEEKICEMMQSKSPEERLRMGSSMFDTSKYLVTQAILRENPQLSPKELRQEVFLRFYGEDFSPLQREKILRHLSFLRCDECGDAAVHGL